MTRCETIGSTRMGVREVVIVTQFQRVTEAAKAMFENRVGSLVVVEDDDDNTMVGIISERDILQWISQASPETYFQRVQDIMTNDVIFCESDVPLTESWKLMKQNGIRHLPVVKNGVAVAMLSVRDLLERQI